MLLSGHRGAALESRVPLHSKNDKFHNCVLGFVTRHALSCHTRAERSTQYSVTGYFVLKRNYGIFITPGVNHSPIFVVEEFPGNHSRPRG